MKSMKNYLTLLIVYSNLLYSQVGINTQNPKETLDVEGTLRIKSLGDYSSTSIPLAWDVNTGKILKGSTDQLKPFYTISYIIKPAPNEDWISNWNTNIPSDNYTVLITSASFEKEGGLSAPLKLFQSGSVGPSVYPFVGTGTWRLYADFKSTAPVESGQFQWTFNLLVINNNLIKALNTVNGVIDSGSSGNSNNPIPN